MISRSNIRRQAASLLALTVLAAAGLVVVAPHAWADDCVNITIAGTPGDDLIFGTPLRDIIDGGAGDDVIFGMGGQDMICGRAGDDHIDDPSLFPIPFLAPFAAAGGDTHLGGEGADHLYGGDGDDVLKGEGGVDYIYGGEHNDYLEGGTGSDLIEGGIGNDRLLGQGDADLLDGGAGNDEVSGAAGNDYEWGGDGNDLVVGGIGDDYLDGDHLGFETAGGTDALDGGVDSDTGRGGPGADDFCLVETLVPAHGCEFIPD